jgi:hypothetical protein
VFASTGWFEQSVWKAKQRLSFPFKFQAQRRGTLTNTVITIIEVEQGRIEVLVCFVRELDNIMRTVLDEVDTSSVNAEIVGLDFHNVPIFMFRLIRLLESEELE